jgi:hypothetical protein
LYAARFLSWTERIGALREDGKWEDALALATDFAEGRARGAVGLPRDPAALRAATAKTVAELLAAYLEEATGRAPADAAAADRHYRHVGNVCIDYCLTINRYESIGGWRCAL